MKRAFALGLPATAVLAALVWLAWPTQPAGRAGPAQPPDPTADRDGPGFWPAVGHESGFTTGLESLPASLAGTEVPDGLRVDSQGRLVVTTSLRDLFDYFLSTLGEEDLETVIARLRSYLRHHLPPEAATEANRILDQYLAFRASLRDLAQPSRQASQLDVDAIRQQQAQIRALRQQYLPAEVEQAFFAGEDTWQAYGLARLETLLDENLDTAAKARRLDQLRQSLPDETRADLDSVLRYQDLQALSRTLQQQGGSESDLRLLREQVVGAEAADRLEALDRQRADFEARLAHWLAQRAALLADTSLAEVDRQHQVEQLRPVHFSEEELIRVTTLERLHDQGPHAAGQN